MSWARCKEWDISFGRILGGFAIYTYQITFGVSLRYWPCSHMPSIRIHFLCFKIWIGFYLKRNKDIDRNTEILQDVFSQTIGVSTSE